jgi:hypothetical protein
VILVVTRECVGEILSEEQRAYDDYGRAGGPDHVSERRARCCGEDLENKDDQSDRPQAQERLHAKGPEKSVANRWEPVVIARVGKPECKQVFVGVVDAECVEQK